MDSKILIIGIVGFLIVTSMGLVPDIFGLGIGSDTLTKVVLSNSILYIVVMSASVKAIL